MCICLPVFRYPAGGRTSLFQRLRDLSLWRTLTHREATRMQQKTLQGTPEPAAGQAGGQHVMRHGEDVLTKGTVGSGAASPTSMGEATSSGSDGGVFVKTWTSHHGAYVTGDVVRHQGRYYVAAGAEGSTEDSVSSRSAENTDDADGADGEDVSASVPLTNVSMPGAFDHILSYVRFGHDLYGGRL